MKTRKALAAVAAVLAASTALTATSSADFFVSLSAQASNNKEQSSAQKYVTPMTTNASSAKYKAFVAAKPLNVHEDYGWYGSTLCWEPVENALIYYIYRMNGKSYTLCAKTSDTTVEVEDAGTYYVRAVTYDYNDKRIFSKKSDKVSVSGYNYDEWYEYEDADDAVAGYAAPEAINSVQSTAKDTAYDEEELDDGYYDDDDDDWEGGELDNEDYSHYDIDGFKNAAQTPLSTFSADVDTASYANVRRLANDGYNIPSDAVRIEEMLNYFDYKYKQPSEKGKFNVHYEYTDCPWNKDAKLLFMGIQAKELEKEPASNLVFLIDVSGSMYSNDKLPLVKDSLKKLVNETTRNDRISIVTYSGMEKVIVAGARGNMKNCISDLADGLVADGCTNGERGMTMAYEIAQKYYKKDGSNRVIMATDGDLNVGITDKEDLSTYISKKRDTGIYLTVLGFGTGNLKDDKMETLAKDGNGNYHYIDCAAEATKVLVDERKKTLVTVADDVKIQVEFNPAVVGSYRLIGYEGRKLNNEDFTDDKKDAADMGAGQSVTVMYELIPAKDGGKSLTYQSANGNKTDVCSLRIAYKEPGASTSKTAGVKIKTKSYCKYKDTGIRFKFAACVAETAMCLRGDKAYGSVSLESVKSRFNALDKKQLAGIGYSDDFASLLAKLK